MAHAQTKPARNQFMECCKLIGSFFVVFIHVPFPGELGGLFTCLARFAVPMFFAISGYFNFRSECDKIRRRLGHILVLNVAAVAVQLVWSFWYTLSYGGSFSDFLRNNCFGFQSYVNWLILNVNPFSGHLWYLSGIFTCYLVLWAYVRFFRGKATDYRLLYMASVLLTVIFFVCVEFSSLLGLSVPYEWVRNGWFFGLPMFTLGIFLREQHPKIWDIFHLTGRKLILLFLTGVLLSIFEWRRFGACDLYLGTLLEVAALMLMMIRHPKLPCRSPLINGIVSRFGSWSTMIYIVHCVFREYYLNFKQYGLFLQIGETEAMIRPFLIIAISLTAAIFWDFLLSGVKWAVGKILKQKEL